MSKRGVNANNEAIRDRELCKRLFELAHDDFISEIVRVSQVAPKGYRASTFTSEFVSTRRNVTITSLLNKSTTLFTKLKDKVTETPDLNKYLRKNRQELQTFLDEGADPFWMVLTLLTSKEDHAMGVLLFSDLDNNHKLEEFVVMLTTRKNLAQVEQAQLQAELDKQAEDDDKERRIIRLEEKIKKQGDQIEELRTQNARLAADLKAAITRATVLQRETDNLSNQLSDKNEEIQQNEKRYNDSLDKIRRNEGNLLGKLNEEKKNHADDIEKLDGEIRELKRLLADSQPVTVSVEHETAEPTSETPAPILVLGRRSDTNQSVLMASSRPSTLYTPQEIEALLDTGQLMQFEHIFVLSYEVPTPIIRRINRAIGTQNINILNDLLSLRRVLS